MSDHTPADSEQSPQETFLLALIRETESYMRHWIDYDACDFNQGRGTCNYGCREEPFCQTGSPGPNGWPSRDERIIRMVSDELIQYGRELAAQAIEAAARDYSEYGYDFLERGKIARIARGEA